MDTDAINSFFQELFTQFFVEDSLIIMTLLLIAFLLGMAVGNLLRSRFIRRLKNDLVDREAEAQGLKASIQPLQEELALTKEQLQKAQYETTVEPQQLQFLEEERNKFRLQVETLQEDRKRLGAQQQAYENRIAELQKDLEAIAQAERTSGGTLDLGSQSPAASIDPDRLSNIEAGLQRLEQENEALRQELISLREQGLPSSNVQQAHQAEEKEEELPEELLPPNRPPLNPDRELVKQQQRDGLTRINRVGPFLEKKLNQAGVFTYQQIAQWTPEDITRITREIQYFEGRIQKDDWVGQARKLMDEEPEESPNAIVSQGQDDLTIIKGINKAIAALLNRANITQLKQIAKADPLQLREILRAAGSEYKEVNPGSWPAQARLAIDENWEVLEDIQASLPDEKP